MKGLTLINLIGLPISTCKYIFLSRDRHCSSAVSPCGMGAVNHVKCQNVPHSTYLTPLPRRQPATVPQPTRWPGKNGHQECYEKFPTAGRQSRTGEKKEGVSLNNFPMWLDFTTPTVGTGAEGRVSGGRLARFCFRCSTLVFVAPEIFPHLQTNEDTKLRQRQTCLAMCQLLEMINTAHTWLKCRNLHNFSR